MALVQLSDLILSQIDRGGRIRRNLNEYPDSMSTANIATSVNLDLLTSEGMQRRTYRKKWGRRDLF